MLVDLRSVLRLADSAALYGGSAAGGRHWIFDIDSGRHFRLNDVSYEAISRIDGTVPVSAIVAECLSKFEVSSEVLKHDLVGLFQRCLDEGLLQEGPDGGAQPPEDAVMGE